MDSDRDRDSVGGSVARSRSGTMDDTVSIGSGIPASPGLMAARQAMQLPADAASLVAFALGPAATTASAVAVAPASLGAPQMPQLPRATALRRLASHFSRPSHSSSYSQSTQTTTPTPSAIKNGHSYSPPASASNALPSALDNSELKECLGWTGLVVPKEIAQRHALPDAVSLQGQADWSEWALGVGAATGGGAGLRLLLHLGAGGVHGGTRTNAIATTTRDLGL